MATTTSKVAMPKVDAGQVNLNTATEQQLEELSGIGPTYARKIIAKRPYKSIDDLSRAGIPAATITQIRSMVTVSSSPSPRTVAKPVTPDPKPTTPDTKPVTPEKTPKLADLNKASEAELQDISGIGEAYSKKIIAGRPYKSVDDLSKTGIPAATIDKIKPQVTVGGTTAPPAKGMVWVNLDTKLYHKESSRWFGKTKSGKYMTEAEAIKAGYTGSKQ
jgi:DNA uptake protein ComE-like DNA-binding protein